MGKPLKPVTHGQCECATPDYGYLPSRRTSLPRDLYQIILLGDRGTGTSVNNLPKVVTWQRNGRELNSRPLESQSQRRNQLTITPRGSGINNPLFTCMPYVVSIKFHRHTHTLVLTVSLSGAVQRTK